MKVDKKQVTKSHASYAAALLGQISARSSCLILWDILGRVQHFLLSPSSSWETRQNAALAVVSVAKNIPISDQIRFLTETGIMENSDNLTKGNNHQGLWLSINDLQSDKKAPTSTKHPIDTIIEHGRLLLSATGTEYDVVPDEYENESNILHSLDQSSLRSQNTETNNPNSLHQQSKHDTFLSKRIRLQRSILMKRLGLGVLYGNADEKNVQEFISNDDLIMVHTKDTHKKSLTNSDATMNHSKSIRQQNIDRIRKKRKLASGIKEQNNTDTCSVDDGSSSTMRALLVLEMKNTTSRKNNNQCSSQASSHGNPQSLLATDFIYHMFDPDWKIRHGAFLGTISLLRAWNFHKMHETRLGVKNSTFEFGRWPDDILCRCLCVLSLDQFCDYAGGTIFKNKSSVENRINDIISTGMVAPVRESASQLLSVVISAAPEKIWNSCWKVLVKMACFKEHWEVRHGAYLAMKYMAAIVMSKNPSSSKSNNAVKEKIRNEMVNVVANGLIDSSDDVKTVAAQVLRSLLNGHSTSAYIPHVNMRIENDKRYSDIIKKCSFPLWNAIISVHNISVCAIDLLTLFSDMVQIECETVLQCICFQKQRYNSLSSESSSTIITEQVLRKLVEFLDFDSITVQLSSLYTLSSVCKPIASVSNLKESEFGRILALFCALLRKYFESFFDPISAEEAHSENDQEGTSHKETMKKLIDARSTSWNVTLDCMINLLTNYCNGPSRNFQKYFGSVHQLLINLLLRFVCIGHEKKGNENQAERGVINHTSTIVSIMDKSISIYRMTMNDDGFYHCILLASKSLAALCTKLSSFIQKNHDFLDNYCNKLVDQFIQSLLYSPWLHMTEAGCFLFLSLSDISQSSDTSVQIETSKSHEILQEMNRSVPTCIIANANRKFLSIKESLSTTTPCDVSLLRFLEMKSTLISSEKGSNLTVQDLIGEWKKLFVSFGLHDVYISNVNHQQYPLSKNSMRIGASVAGAIISDQSHPLPSKLTPLIRHLMNSLKNEKNKSRQNQTCHHIIRLIVRLDQSLVHQESRTSNLIRVRDKIIENICSLCCSEQHVFEIVKDRNVSIDDSPAIQVIQAVMNHFQNEEMKSIAPLWNRFSPLANIGVNLLAQPQLSQTLQMICILSKSSNYESTLIKDAIAKFVPTLSSLACSSPSSLIRQQAVIATTYFCKGNPSRAIKILLPSLFDSLSDLSNESRRFGGCILLQSIIDNISLDICPFVRDLLPISMSMMTDIVEECAKCAANIFASLVRVAPLVQIPSLSEQSCLDKEKKDSDLSGKVIDHLIYGKPIPFCSLPEPLLDELRQGNTILRSYQRDGISWIRFLQSVNLNGALCDDMGLGKTLQALVGIGLAHCQKISNDNNKHSNEVIKSLVVCPSTLCGHWFNEITRFFSIGQFYQVLRHDGNSKKRKSSWRLGINTANIIVTSYSVLRQDIDILSSVMWTYCILDEGHLLKNPKTATAKAAKQIRSMHKLILTGTPIQNRVNELWAIFDFLMPNFLGNEKVFTKNYAKPIAKGQAPGATAHEIALGIEKLKMLHQQVLPFILRREKTHVLKELPPKNITDIPCSMSEEQIQLYERMGTRQDIDAHMKSLHDQLIKGAKKIAIGKDTLKRILFMRLVCTHPLLVMSKSHSDDALDDKYFRLECSGKMSALNDLMRHAGIYSDELTAADNDHSSVYIKGTNTEINSIEHEFDSYLEHQTNMATVENKTFNKSKCLIFAQFKQSLDIVERLLFQPHMPSLRYLRLDGTVPPEERTKLVDTFHQDDSIKVMLLSTKVGSLGLNLTCADTVIFLEMDWNPQVDLQAMDRAHRIGQKKVVNVYRLVSSGTIEDQILKLQRVKMKMAESIVNSENSTMYSMGTDRLLDIFTTSGEIDSSNPAEENVLDTMNNIWTQDEYKELLSVDGFLSMLGS